MSKLQSSTTSSSFSTARPVCSTRSSGRPGSTSSRPDGIYWMPPDASYETWDGQPAIFAEDKNLMTVRMGGVLHPDAWSQRPLWGTDHVVANVTIDKAAKNGDVTVRSRFHMMELRRDDVRHFAGQYTHHLRKAKGGYRIKLQRVDMTNAQAAYDYVLQVWV